MAEKITFSSENFAIEGLLHKHSDTRGAVITHPHPLYGGSMDNHVVSTICHACQQLNRTTLRFNFRGVGSSQGRYGDGVGEQADVRAAVAYLAELGIEKIDLVGYSFGAWVNAHLTCAAAGIDRMVMVSPPVAFIDFAAVADIDCLQLIVSGSRDDIAPPGMIEEFYPNWNREARLEIIDGADHFYGGFEDQLVHALTSNLK